MRVVAAVVLLILLQGIDSQTVTITSDAGTPVSGSTTTTYDYPILSSVTLTCSVSPSSFTVTAYQWNTTGCYTNSKFTPSNPECFPHGQTTQTVTGNNLNAEDAGTITCTAMISGMPYTSEPFTLRISGVAVTSESLVLTDAVTDYSYIISDSNIGTFLARCLTGLGPTSTNIGANGELGGFYFNGTMIPNDGESSSCGGRSVGVIAWSGGAAAGVINLRRCITLTTDYEGVYTCALRSSTMMNESVRFGIYIDGRTPPMISTPSSPSSTMMAVNGSPLTLSCTSQNSPPDTFTWRKDNGLILQSTTTPVIYNDNSAVFRTDYSIDSVTTSDSRTYTCTVANPIGSDSATITVVVTNLCTITPINPTTLTATGGEISSGTMNVRILCNCTRSNGNAVSVVRWYDPNGNTLISSLNGGFDDSVPHFTRVGGDMGNNFDDSNVILVIPTFTDSYDGTYTCGREVNDFSNIGSPTAAVTLTIDVTCPSLTDPTNGMISCSLEGDGVPNPEDTCTFTCNSGYELMGNVTRTCGNDGSWSGSDATCSRVITCPQLTNPSNGMISCSLGDNDIPNPEETCTVTCDDGYQSSGTRTCQNDGSWSGSDAVCIITCLTLTDPANGMISCSLGDDEVPNPEETCTVTCDDGYELTGSDARTCQNNGSWSGSDAICSRITCPSFTSLSNGMITCSESDRVSSPVETCTFKCDSGYELIINSTKDCQNNGSWSGIGAMCSRVTNSRSSGSSSDDNSDDSGVIIALAGLLVVAAIVIVISIVINVILVVKLKRSRYDVNQSNIRYSDVKQSVYNTTTDSTDKKTVKPSEPEYEAIQTDSKAKMKVDYDVEMDTNPAYECDVKMDSNPAYQATS